MNRIKKFFYNKAKHLIQFSAFMVAIYAANTSCILIFHQEEMPKAVQELSRFKM